MTDFLETWHRVVFEGDEAALNGLLDDNVVFRSPVVWKPKEGKMMTKAILMTVGQIFQDFRYHREINQGNDWCLEFSATVNGLNVKGIDMIHLNDEGQITDFEVMMRPANGVQALGGEMMKRWAAIEASSQK